MSRFAVFDLDKTMTKRGTWGRFVSRSVGYNPIKLLSIWSVAGLKQLRYKSGDIDRIGVKRAMLRRSLTGMNRAKLLALADKFADDEVSSGLNPGFIAELEKCRAADDHILIASAGADILIGRIAERLGIEHWVATDLAWEGDRCADHFATDNCYGEGKLTRLKTLLETFPDYDSRTAQVTFYSDSHSDLPCFEFSNRCVAVNGTAKLKTIAISRNWEIVDWS